MTHNHQKGDEKVNVAVRCRPMFASERKLRKAVECSSNSKEINVVTGYSTSGLSQAQTTKTFTLDKVFGPNATQLDVYDSVVSPQLHDVLNGYNCTVLAYGQTGTGKTFTMEGEKTLGQDFTWDTDPKAGLIPRAMSHLFDFLQNSGCEFSVRVSLLEIYNEDIYDLLSTSDQLLKMNIYNDSNRKGSVVVSGLTEIHVRHKSEIYAILQQGANKRRTAATDINEFSSRSHSVFSVTVHYKEVAQNQMEEEELVKIGKLNLVDLAGSENIGRSGAVNKRAREAGSINQSLLTLGRCITALVDHSRHIPYRASKLTRLLQDSLGGTTKTSIIATISPGSGNVEETLSTLEYACRAKNIQNRPKVNQKLTKRILIKQYDDEIERLRREVICLREKNGIHIPEEEHEKLTKGLEEIQATLQQRETEMTELQSLFDINSTELRETTNKLIVVMEDLQVTSTLLSETQVIKDAHIRHGSKLKSQANELLKVADVVSKDIEKVHDKVERQEATNINNLQATKLSTKSVQTKLELVCTDTHNLVQENNKQLEHTLTIHASSVERQKKYTNILSNELQHWQQDITRSMEKNLNLFEELNNILEDNSSNHKDIKKECKSWLANIVEKTVTKMNSFNRGVEGLNDVVQHLQATTNQHDQLLKKQIHNSVNYEEKMKENMSEVKSIVHQITGQQENSFTKFLDNFNKNVGEYMLDMKARNSKTDNQMNELTNAVTESTEEYVKLQQVQNNELIEELADDNNRVTTAINTAVKSSNALYCELNEDLNKINTTYEETSANLDEVCKKMQSQSKKYTEKAAKNTKIVEESEYVTKLTEIITQESKSHEQDATTLVTAATDMLDNNVTIATHLEQKCLEINSELDDLLKDKLKPVESLGVTPRRKKYQYNRDIPRTPGDQSILEEHQHQMEQEQEEAEVRPLEYPESEESESGASLTSNEPDLNQSLTIPDGGGQPFFFNRKKRVEKTHNNKNICSRIPLRPQNH